MQLDKSLYVWILLALILSLLALSPAIGLLAGILISVIFKIEHRSEISKLSKQFLQLAVILLGFKLQIMTVIEVGRDSVFITAATIILVMAVGYLLGRIFKLEQKLSTLISGGTAICGGSAIAAFAPVISASSVQIAVSMGIVFLLNALALFIFPSIGHYFSLTQEQFGLWAAIAIHDTSSVVGATVSYGAEAASIGTTVKLVRALWILPVAFVLARFYKSESKAKFPLFLIGFLLASVLRSVFPAFENVWNFLSQAGSQLMTGTLFLIGLTLSVKNIKEVGVKTLSFAFLLWLLISVVSLVLIMSWGSGLHF